MALTKVNKLARKEFVDLYGTVQRDVVRLIASDWDTHEISDKLNLPVMSIAATRANVTRGTYLPFIAGDVMVGFEGTCQF